MNLGADFHDTITYAPQFFRTLFEFWPYEKYVITGTPENDRSLVEQSLNDLQINYTKLLMGFNYSKSDMSSLHFKKMGQHKLSLIQTNNIVIYYDDNPFYANFLRNYGVKVFQTIIDDNYMLKYDELGDKYFSCHLQKDQFKFLESI